MSETPAPVALPVFEIDQPAVYGQFLVDDPVEIGAYLRALHKRHAIVVIYLDAGLSFFLSSLLAVDEVQAAIFLAPAPTPELNRQVAKARTITVTSDMDRVKIQFHLAALSDARLAEQAALKATLPGAMLRLQRRQHFRLETPPSPALTCRLAERLDDGSIRTFHLPLVDLSGGGLSLTTSREVAEHFPTGKLFQDCRLEIPGEGVISINFCVRETRLGDAGGEPPQWRVGGEFVSLPGDRLARIERYITRIERERKARQASLG